MYNRAIRSEAVEAYLRRHVSPDARLVELAPLGDDEDAGAQQFGYGRPLRITWEEPGDRGPVLRRAALYTMSADSRGHDRRADRIATLVEAAADFRAVPRHARPFDVGTFDAAGLLVPIAPGEAWLLSEHLEGRPYARALAEAARLDRPRAIDVERAGALADYLAALHAPARPADDHTRHVRDTLGGGEGIFGLVDAWPAGHAVATHERLQRFEQAALAWRWRLKDRSDRARRIHGDFHPFNVLFREGTDFSVLHASRRASGDPADDVTCMAINFLFFALTARASWSGACRELWATFWARYLTASRDEAVLDVVAPWFAWRALVIASPVWYPATSDDVRETMLAFAERWLSGARFDPFRADLVP